MRRSSCFVGAVADAGGVDHVLFDQNAADVVGAELQADLANLDSRREPARLDVIDVVEIEPADGERLQVIERGRFRNFFPERRIFRRENPRNERGESAGVLLNSAQPLEMIHAVANFFAAAEHHRRRGAHAERVRGAVHLFPFVRCALQPRDARAHFVVEDFCAAAGNRIESRIAQPRNRVAKVEARKLRRCT